MRRYELHTVLRSDYASEELEDLFPEFHNSRPLGHISICGCWSIDQKTSSSVEEVYFVLPSLDLVTHEWADRCCEYAAG